MSTAPWDQPRNATTVTLQRPDAATATARQLLAQLRRESPHLASPKIDFINWRRSPHQGEPGQVCCLISWRAERQ